MSFESGRSSFQVLASFLAWTVTSFLCHKLGKEFLVSAEKSWPGQYGGSPAMVKGLLALALTLTQSSVCLLTVQPFSQRSMGITQIMMVSHFLATLATNLSMAFIQAASTFAIKLTEPVTMAIAHRLVFKTPIAIETWMSLPMIIIGALIFSGTALNEASSILGVSLAALSNVILAARNVSMKKLQDPGKSGNPGETHGDKSQATKQNGGIQLRGIKILLAVGAGLAACVFTSGYIFG